MTSIAAFRIPLAGLFVFLGGCSTPEKKAAATGDKKPTAEVLDSSGSASAARDTDPPRARDARDATQQAPTRPTLTVTFFDIGQGDSALVRTPSGKSILIDGGVPEAGPALVRQLQALGIDTIDLVIASHAHADHIGGLLDVLRAFKVRAFLDSGVPHPTPTYRAFLKEVERQKTEFGAKFWIARKGRTIGFDEDGVKVRVLAPEDPLLTGTRSDVNSNSVVVNIAFGDTQFLFTGDAEASTEARLVKQGTAIRARVLKVAHHGSRHSTTRAFLAAVNPEIAVISCGRDNSYGHPKPTTVRALEAIARVLRTDRDGTVTVTSDGKTLVATRAGVVEQTDAPANDTPMRAYVASRRAKTFHRSDCPGAAKIRGDNRIDFGTWGEAAATGRKPHKRCMP